MKKNNWIIAIAAVIFAIILCVIYVSLGFQQVDHNLDIWMAIIWVALVAGFAAIIQWREAVRKRLVRRFFISDDSIYNSELGVADSDQVLVGDNATEFANFAVNGYDMMEYAFDVAAEPDGFDPKFVVDAKSFKAHRNDSNKLVVDRWKGDLYRCEKDQDGKMQLVEEGTYADENSLIELLKNKQVFA